MPCLIVYDKDRIYEEIKKFPQTYDTLIGKCFVNSTEQTILRRKVSKMCEEGEIYRTVIPGTRKGKIIFYVSPKEYHIVVESLRTSTDVFVFFQYKRQKFYIITEKCWKLDGCFWKEVFDKVFFEGDLLKVI